MTSAAAPPILGPLHRQVHARILVALERERHVADACVERLGDGAQLAVEQAREQHPVVAANATLEELVGDRDPHDVLSALVAATHRREGAVYAALLAREGDEAEVHLRLAAWDHGVETGRRVAQAERRLPSGPGDVFDLLGETLLETMPCRASATLLSETPGRVTWKHDACPYAEEWSRVAAPQASACSIVSAWVRGFTAGVDGTVEYRRPRALALGDERCEHELTVID